MEGGGWTVQADQCHQKSPHKRKREAGESESQKGMGGWKQKTDRQTHTGGGGWRQTRGCSTLALMLEEGAVDADASRS